MQAVDFNIYACPTCKGQLMLEQDALSCPTCNVTYQIIDGIPNLIVGSETWSSSPVIRWVGRCYGWQAYIYDWPRCPLMITLCGGLGSPSFKELMRVIAGMVKIDEGLTLDVACGPGAFGRRIASESRTVYGIDISMGILRRGMAYVRRHHIPNVRLVRARAEALPFGNDVYDAALCVAALHLFADPVSALYEICRTMKEGAPLAAMTLIAGNKGLMRSRRFRKLAQRCGAHIFEIAELEQHLIKIGFEDFRPIVYGSLILFSARKRQVQR